VQKRATTGDGGLFSTAKFRKMESAIKASACRFFEPFLPGSPSAQRRLAHRELTVE
jgi:hypothetical protein